MSILEAGINKTQVLKNLNTPLAFLPPDVAKQYMVENYADVAALAVLIWDILVHLPLDYRLAVRYKINMSFLIYGLSRITTLAYVFGVVIVSTVPIGDCSYFRKVTYLYPFTTPVTLFLFLLRTSALYNDNKYVIGILSLSWIGVLVCAILVPLGVSANPIGNTGYCLEFKTAQARGFERIATFVHDVIVFFATSWGLMMNSYSNTFKGKLQAIILGKYLPTFSKSLLHDGQAYFLATLLFSIAAILIDVLPVANISSCTFVLPLSVLIHNMSCYIYRKVRLGVYSDSLISSSFIHGQLRRSGGGEKRPNASCPLDVASLPVQKGDGQGRVSGVEESVL